MDVGLQMVFSSYGWTNVSDAEVWDEELRLARPAADLGTAAVILPWHDPLRVAETHRALVREIHGREAGPPLLADFCACTPGSNFHHYELLGEHFSAVEGYDAYAQKIAMARELGMDGIVSAFMEAAVWGPPDRILRKREERRALVGDFELATSFRFGGTPFDVAETGLRLYAMEVVPVVRSWARAAPAS
jgi:hypothetical protein